MILRRGLNPDPLAVETKLDSAPVITLFAAVLTALLPDQIVCHLGVCFFHSTLPEESVILVTSPSGIVKLLT